MFKLVWATMAAVHATEMTLRARYKGNDFLEHFDFFSESDPTHGVVDYKTRDDAIAEGLVSVSGQQFKMTAGRPPAKGGNLPSVRIEGRHSLAGSVE